MNPQEFVPSSRGPSRWGSTSALISALVLGTALLSAPAAAQTGRVTGTTTDRTSGAPVGEVQVFLPGLGLGALSRANGRYLILNVPPGTYDISAQRVGLGMVTQSITVGDGETLEVNFQLESQALGLDEIVVTGAAGSARRREIGNTISQINVGDMVALPTATTDILQAAAPGIEVTGGSGEIGQGKQIRLRGNSSVSMSNQPIIYVDGVRMMDGAFPTVNGGDFPGGRGALVTSSPLDNINPNDIDRIEVIKGSAATTLFGTEASAGVIQIFTKRGAEGAPVWSMEIQQGTSWMRKFGMNGADYLHMEHYLRDSWFGGGYEGGDMSEDCVVDPESRWGNNNSSPEGACSWPGTAWSQRYDLSVRGGGQSLQYFISGGYQDDVGVLARDELTSYSFRGNFTVSPLDDLQLQWNTAYSNQWTSNTATGNNAQGITLNAFRQERNYFGTGDPERIAVVLDNDLQNRIERFTSGATLTYTPITNLSNRFTVGYDFSQQEGRNLRNFGYEQFPQGGLTNNTWQKRVLTFDYVGTYNFPLTEGLRTSLSWGGQAIGDETRELQGWGENFPGAGVPTVSNAAIRIADENRQKIWNAGFFLQNVFDVSNRYFLTTGLRVDGNSAFGEGFGLQLYPKVSGTWVVSEEGFWSEGWGQVKLRSAYGQSGRAPGAFDAVRTWNSAGYAGTPAFVPANLGSPDLGPEVTGEFEVGFDGAWLSDRLTAAFTYYRQKTTDALMSVTSIPSMGFTQSQLRNVGTIGNRGFEVDVTGTPFQFPNWGLTVGLNVSTNNSEVLDLGGAPEFNDLNGRIIEGQPVPVLVDRRVANRDEIGPWVYENDGQDVIIGPQLPTHFVVPSLSLRGPAGVVLSARGEYRGGNMMEINPMSIGRSVRSPICFPYYVDPRTSIALRDDTPALWRERCTPANGDDYWFDADYFKLRSVSLTIPMDFAFPERVGGSTLTASLNNGYMWTREIPWYDPEILGNEAANDDGLGQTERVPSPISFRLSFRVTF